MPPEAATPWPRCRAPTTAHPESRFFSRWRTRSRPTPPRSASTLLFVDGEDYGDFSEDKDVLLGSRYYAKNPLSDPKPRYAVLFDMVGDAMLQLRQEGYSLTGAPDVVALVWKTAERLGYQTTFLIEPMTGMTDDHIALQSIGIPPSTSSISSTVPTTNTTTRRKTPTTR
jgi:hypothetical protein